MLRIQAFLLLFVVTIVIALLKGSREERATACILVGAAVATGLVMQPLPSRGVTFDLGVFLVDLTTWLLLVALMCRSDRLWLILMVALQNAVLLFHAMKAVAPDILARFYWDYTAGWSWAMLLLLLASTVRTMRARRTTPTC
ncbi:hypothetical protein [Sphingomonas jatrophae]|uniref:Uncharacterized protein n=1 Tax=Sphingomonas jatrophae TaxID=1166337 RepID=A0A1I6JNJ3_9SPHN|nr:hypothetical protein [Sphingomonas jatrophae]SFR80535.1 hypothetical protein SAMN05192580_0588 [Sphingomonas jatrophae]